MTKLYITMGFLPTILATIMLIILGVFHSPFMFGFSLLLPFSVMYSYDKIVYKLRNAFSAGFRHVAVKDENFKSLNDKDKVTWLDIKFPNNINYTKMAVPTSSVDLINDMFRHWRFVGKPARDKKYGHVIYINGILGYFTLFLGNISLIHVSFGLAIYFISVLCFVLLEEYAYKHGPKALAKRCNDIAHKNGWYNPYRVSMKVAHLNKSYKYDIK